MDLDQNTDISVLLTAFLLIGIGFGFADAPLTNTAVSDLPRSQAGVAGGITSAARQVGSAVGIVLAGGLVACVAPTGIAEASRTGWLLVTVCGLLLLAAALTSHCPGAIFGLGGRMLHRYPQEGIHSATIRRKGMIRVGGAGQAEGCCPRGVFMTGDSRRRPQGVHTMSSSLKSFNIDNHFVRHANFLAELSAVASDLDRADATFEMVNGLADRNLVSFRSVNFPLHFLRHQDFRVKLHEGPNTPLVPPGSTPPPEPPDMQLMRKDATFAMIPGLVDPNAVSFRSFNFPNRFLRHRDFHLFVEEVHSDLDRKDATFMVVPGLSPEPPGPH